LIQSAIVNADLCPSSANNQNAFFGPRFWSFGKHTKISFHFCHKQTHKGSPDDGGIIISQHELERAK